MRIVNEVDVSEYRRYKLSDRKQCSRTAFCMKNPSLQTGIFLYDHAFDSFELIGVGTLRAVGCEPDGIINERRQFPVGAADHPDLRQCQLLFKIPQAAVFEVGAGIGEDDDQILSSCLQDMFHLIGIGNIGLNLLSQHAQVDLQIGCSILCLQHAAGINMFIIMNIPAQAENLFLIQGGKCLPDGRRDMICLFVNDISSGFFKAVGSIIQKHLQLSKVIEADVPDKAGQGTGADMTLCCQFLDAEILDLVLMGKDIFGNDAVGGVFLLGSQGTEKDNRQFIVDHDFTIAFPQKKKMPGGIFFGRWNRIGCLYFPEARLYSRRSFSGEGSMPQASMILKANG